MAAPPLLDQGCAGAQRHRPMREGLRPDPAGDQQDDGERRAADHRAPQAACLQRALGCAHRQHAPHERSQRQHGEAGERQPAEHAAQRPGQQVDQGRCEVHVEQGVERPGEALADYQIGKLEDQDQRARQADAPGHGEPDPTAAQRGHERQQGEQHHDLARHAEQMSHVESAGLDRQVPDQRQPGECGQQPERTPALCGVRGGRSRGRAVDHFSASSRA